MFRLMPIIFAIVMASIDAIVLPIIKYINDGFYPIYLLILALFNKISLIFFTL
jgi:hypothetical protein